MERKSSSWDIEIDLLKNLFIIVATWKVFLLASLVVPILLFFLDLIEKNLSFESLFIYMKIYGILVSIFTVLLLISYYLIFIPIAGRKYELTFVMDNQGINHIVKEKQRKKNFLFLVMGITAGVAANNPGVAGANMIAYSRQNMYTSYQKVRKIIYNRKNGIIQLRCSDLTRNAIFTSKDNSEMVFQYICEHSKKAVIKLK